MLTTSHERTSQGAANTTQTFAGYTKPLREKPSPEAAAEKFRALDMRLASQMQKSMLPDIPEIPGWDVAYHFQPMTEVSGDLIDIYRFGDTFFDEEESEPNAGLLLADASGHGVSAALATMIARQIFFHSHREYRNHGLATAMFNANVELRRDLANTGLYLTGVYIKFEKNGFRYVNGSHPKLLYLQRSSGKIFALPNDGLLFGLSEMGGSLRERSVRCDRGDVIIAYTDGLIEQGPGGADARHDFGVEGIFRAVRQTWLGWSESAWPEAPAKDLKALVLEAAAEHQKKHGVQAADDVTFAISVKE